MSLNSKINLAHAVSWAFTAGELDISKIGELMQEQERTELQETAVHQTAFGEECMDTARHPPDSSRASKILT